MGISVPSFYDDAVHCITVHALVVVPHCHQMFEPKYDLGTWECGILVSCLSLPCLLPVSTFPPTGGSINPGVEQRGMSGPHAEPTISLSWAGPRPVGGPEHGSPGTGFPTNPALSVDSLLSLGLGDTGAPGGGRAWWLVVPDLVNRGRLLNNRIGFRSSQPRLGWGVCRCFLPFHLLAIPPRATSDFCSCLFVLSLVVLRTALQYRVRPTFLPRSTNDTTRPEQGCLTATLVCELCIIGRTGTRTDRTRKWRASSNSRWWRCQCRGSCGMCLSLSIMVFSP